jgi:1-acyl-sn-glycerol-3-phosphate acyltransferase
VLRPVNVLGYYVHSMIGEYLRQSRVPTVMGFDPMMQFIHEEDVSEAIALALEHGLQGVFNVVGPGAVPLSVAIRESRRTAWPLPEPLLRPLLDRLFRLGPRAVPVGAMDYVKYPVTLSGKRFGDATGFRPALRPRRDLPQRAALRSRCVNARRGWRAALGDLAGALLPLSVRDLEREIDDRIRKIPTRLNEYGFDPWGLHPETVRETLLPALLLYRYWFRVQTHDIERVPPGRVLLVANHAGQLPFDAAMISIAMLLEAEPPRIVRGMARVLGLGAALGQRVFATRGGAASGRPDTCREMLEAGEAVLVFPEGVRGMNKLYRTAIGSALRHRLPAPRARGAGADRADRRRRLRGAAAGAREPARARAPARHARLPGDPTFPWLGPLGLLPLPVKYHLYFGEPLHFQGSPATRTP